MLMKGGIVYGERHGVSCREFLSEDVGSMNKVRMGACLIERHARAPSFGVCRWDLEDDDEVKEDGLGVRKTASLVCP